MHNLLFAIQLECMFQYMTINPRCSRKDFALDLLADIAACPAIPRHQIHSVVANVRG